MKHIKITPEPKPEQQMKEEALWVVVWILVLFAITAPLIKW